jgi:diguanylate cyclase (GGDEF)-like protein
MLARPHALFNKRVLLLCTSAGLIAFVIAAGFIMRARTYQAEKASLINEATIGVEACGQHTIQILNQVDMLLHGVRMTYIRTGSVSTTEQFIRGLNFDTAIIENIYIVQADGRFIIPHDKASQSKSVVVREYFHYHQTTPTDQFYISAVEKGYISEKYRFRITRRINNADGSFGGVIIATVNPQSFTRYYSELHLGTQSLASLVGLQDKKLRARIPEPNEDKWAMSIPADYILWKSLEQAETGHFESVSPVDNISRTFVYRKVTGLPLVMVIGFSNADVENKVAERQNWITFTEAIVVLFIVMITSALLVVLIGRDKLASANQDLEKLYSQLQKIALFDSLTGLPNRVLFSDRFQHALQRAKRNGEHCILMYIDLDGFKAVNDSLGHDAGDKALKVVSDRMLQVVRSTDTLCRWGGDEFLIVLTQSDGAIKEIFEISKRLLAVVKKPVVCDTTSCAVSASIGIALFPDHGQTQEALLKAADTAMYLAKQRGKNQVVIASSHNTATDDNQA